MEKHEVIDRLKQHLQTALMLELSTMPPYLCALWSVHGSSEHAAHTGKFILSIVQEEMLHLAMACNILNAIGGSPVMNDAARLPVFPGALPGHSRTANAFSVQLNKCCPQAIELFLKIELPEQLAGSKAHPDGWCTIGEFYDEIEALIKHESLSDEDFAHGRQMSNKVNPAKGTLYEVHNRADALKALEEIIDQGEGHSGKMYDNDHELTHYWKFYTIRDLMEKEIWDFTEEVYDMAPNPDESFFTDEAKKLCNDFNACWTELLDELTAAFNAEKPNLNKAINTMFKLKGPAIGLMQIPLAGRKGNAGPTFIYNKQQLNALSSNGSSQAGYS